MRKKHIFIAVIALLLLSGCSSKSPSRYGSLYNTLGGFGSAPSHSSHSGYNRSKITKNRAGFLKLNPYTVFGKRYYPHLVDVGETFTGVASWYGPTFHAKATSNGETYNMHDFTCAHKTFPMHTMLKVTNLTNGKTTTVRVNDRGPFVGTRIIDLSNAAARQIDMVGAGTAKVKLEVIGIHELAHKEYTPSKIKTTTKPKVTIKKKVVKPKGAKVANSSFSVQIGSFSSIDGAMAFRQMHDKKHGYNSVIKDSISNEKQILRVCLEGFKDESEARGFINSGLFENAYILRSNP